jgi:hypothetical protein
MEVKTTLKPTPQNELFVTASEFAESFNRNMPEGYPRVTMDILKKFKNSHQSLFKPDGLWSLDIHRKRMIDWLPQNM